MHSKRCRHLITPDAVHRHRLGGVSFAEFVVGRRRIDDSNELRGVLVFDRPRRSGVVEQDRPRVRLRDGRCRWPGCDRRTGLQIHHLWPRSWGGTDHVANLAAVCVGGGTDHHAQLARMATSSCSAIPTNPTASA